MPGKGTIDALFLVRRLQEQQQAKDKKMYMCFVDLKKAFNRVPRTVMEWTIRKKDLYFIVLLVSRLISKIKNLKTANVSTVN